MGSITTLISLTTVARRISLLEHKMGLTLKGPLTRFRGRLPRNGDYRVCCVMTEKDSLFNLCQRNSTALLIVKITYQLFDQYPQNLMV